MRALPAALIVSFALHGAAIAWVGLAPGDVKALPAVAPTAVEIVPPEPMVVALLDDHTVVPALPATSHAGSTKSALSPKLAASTRVEPETRLVTPPVTPDTQQPHNPLMSMRRPDLSVDNIHDPGAELVVPSEPQLGNANWIANASPQEVAAARFAAVARNEQEAHRELRPDGQGTKSEHEAFKIRYDADGTAHIQDKANLQRKGLLSGSFDVTEAMMRSHGVDPYASYKLKVLDETRDERVAIGKRYKTQQLARTPEIVQKNLAYVWASTTEPAARKQALFDLWDDCAEGAADTDELAAAGKTARNHIIGFIRSKLPEGSAGAFTSDDIARLNRTRRSHVTFAPY